MIPNPQTNVQIADPGGRTLYYRGQASVDLAAQPQVITVWGGERAPGAAFYYGQPYYCQGSPSLESRVLFWWKDAYGFLHFVIDNS